MPGFDTRGLDTRSALLNQRVLAEQPRAIRTRVYRAAAQRAELGALTAAHLDAIDLLIESESVFGRVFTHGRYDIGQKLDFLDRMARTLAAGSTSRTSWSFALARPASRKRWSGLPRSTAMPAR